MDACTVCCCCDNSVSDKGDRRRLYSAAGQVVLLEVVGSHFYAGQKDEYETQRLVIPTASEPYICRQPCLLRLQKHVLKVIEYTW